MNVDASKIFKLVLKFKEYVTYGDNNKGKVLGRGDIGDNSSIIIQNVLYVEGLKHNLLSISLLCDKGEKDLLDIFSKFRMNHSENTAETKNLLMN